MGLEHPHRTDFTQVRREYFEAIELVGETWVRLRTEARRMLEREPSLDAQLTSLIFERASLASSSASLTAHLVSDDRQERDFYSSLVADILSENQRLVHFACLDLLAPHRAGPQRATVLERYVFSARFHALQCHRICNWLWNRDRVELALQLQAAAERRSGIAIHPSVNVGHGIILDDGGAVTLGENASIGNNVRLGAGVLVCRSGAVPGSGAPRLSDAVTLGAGARVIGPVSLGTGSAVREGSTVLQDVAPFEVVQGDPARVIGHNEPPIPHAPATN